MSELFNDSQYQELLKAIKDKIQHAQVRAVVAAYGQMLLLYWEIGNLILERQKTRGWGSKVTEQLAKDLKRAFPGMKGFTRRNLLYMRRLATTYAKNEFVKQAVSQIGWSHNIKLMQKCATNQERFWYAQKALQNGWSRSILTIQIEQDLYNRQRKAISNFSTQLPAPQSDMAQQALKDPFLLDFLELKEDFLEKELEDAIVQHITKFLLTLGRGFAYVGRQFPVEVEGKDYSIDLLFYHLKLYRYVAVDLKIGDFKPEYAGKMNFYLSAIDDNIRGDKDNTSIGIILCKNRNKVMAEYALRNLNTPIGISTFQLSKIVPDDFKSSLPTVEELEKELRDIEEEE